MKTDELIDTDEICTRYRVERTFINFLGESGLIEIMRLEQKEFLHCDHIAEFEKMRRLHYDLKINLEGLEAVQQLLDKVQRLQQENMRLKNRLHIFE